MKSPDKIYVNIPEDYWVPGIGKKAIGDTEYIRKDALLELLNEYKDNPVITELQRGNIQELIEKIESL